MNFAKINKLAKIDKLLMLLILLAASSLVSAANAGGRASAAFSKGSTSMGVVLGSGRAFNDDYVIFGISVGYYVFQGLELGVDAQHWFSGEPSITKLSPQIRYVFTQSAGVKPYLGAFYRRTTFGEYNGISLDDQDSFGYRAGAYFSSGNGVYIGGGIVYEEYTNCGAFVDCSTTYPEFLVTLSF